MLNLIISFIMFILFIIILVNARSNKSVDGGGKIAMLCMGIAILASGVVSYSELSRDLRIITDNIVEYSMEDIAELNSQNNTDFKFKGMSYYKTSSGNYIMMCHYIDDIDHYIVYNEELGICDVDVKYEEVRENAEETNEVISRPKYLSEYNAFQNSDGELCCKELENMTLEKLWNRSTMYYGGTKRLTREYKMLDIFLS